MKIFLELPDYQNFLSNLVNNYFHHVHDRYTVHTGNGHFNTYNTSPVIDRDWQFRAIAVPVN